VVIDSNTKRSLGDLLSDYITVKIANDLFGFENCWSGSCADQMRSRRWLRGTLLRLIVVKYVVAEVDTIGTDGPM
jgi:hypothetical protein